MGGVSPGGGATGVIEDLRRIRVLIKRDFMVGQNPGRRRTVDVLTGALMRGVSRCDLGVFGPPIPTHFSFSFVH